jgi:hypothetical protein
MTTDLHAVEPTATNGSGPDLDPVQERVFLDRYALKDVDG